MSSIGNMFGGLLGETDSQYQAKLANNAAGSANTQGTQLRNQAQGGYANLNQQGNAGQGQIGNGYGQLGNIGQQESNTFLNALPGMIANYQNTAGIGSGQSQANPYALNEAQQTQLSGQNDALGQRLTNATQAYHAQMARAGITDPSVLAAGEGQLKSSFGGLMNNNSANFAQTALQNNQGAQMSLMNYLQGIGQQGASNLAQGTAGATQQQEAGNSGLAGLAGQASGVGQQQSQLAMQNTANNNAGLSSLLNLAGYGVGGGFTGLFGGRGNKDTVGSNEYGLNSTTYGPQDMPQTTQPMGGQY